MSSSVNLNVLSSYRSVLGESPLWDKMNELICWVDIFGENILVFDAQTNNLQKISLGQPVGCIALNKENNFVAALKNEVVIIDRKQGKVSKVLANPEATIENNRSNDGKCDPAGRFWFGTKSLSDENDKGCVYMIDATCCKKKIEAVTISNGMAWSPDAKLFYYIDTPTQQVVAYDYDLKTGSIFNKRTVITVKITDGFPDGMTIDTEGMLWIAFWDGWKVARYSPFTGELLHTIALPVAKVTSCVFGGPDLTDLYITSARVGLTTEELEQQLLAGSLFVVKNCGFRGLDAYRFEG